MMRNIGEDSQELSNASGGKRTWIFEKSTNRLVHWSVDHVPKFSSSIETQSLLQPHLTNLR